MGERITSNLIASALMGSRAIAGLTVVTIVAIALETYLRKCVLDDEMEDWCQKSAFHKSDSREKFYKTVDEEYEGFMKAIVSV